jgi:hypothetical protein
LSDHILPKGNIFYKCIIFDFHGCENNVPMATSARGKPPALILTTVKSGTNFSRNYFQVYFIPSLFVINGEIEA